MRLGKFIKSLISLAISVGLLYVCYKLNNSLFSAVGLEKISYITNVPIAAISYLFLIISSISGTSSSFKAIGSTNIIIKIISIVLFVAAVFVLVSAADLLIKFITIF